MLTCSFAIASPMRCMFSIWSTASISRTLPGSISLSPRPSSRFRVNPMVQRWYVSNFVAPNRAPTVSSAFADGAPSFTPASLISRIADRTPGGLSPISNINRFAEDSRRPPVRHRVFGPIQNVVVRRFPSRDRQRTISGAERDQQQLVHSGRSTIRVTWLRRLQEYLKRGIVERTNAAIDELVLDRSPRCVRHRHFLRRKVRWRGRTRTHHLPQR